MTRTLLVFALAAAACGARPHVATTRAELTGWTRTVMVAQNTTDRVGADGAKNGTCPTGPCIVSGWEQGGAVTAAYVDDSGIIAPCTNAGAEDAIEADIDGDGTPDYVSASETGRQIKICGGGWTLVIKNASVPSLPLGRYMQLDYAGGTLYLGGKVGSTGIVGTLGYFTVSGSARLASSWSYHELTTVGWTMALRALDMDGDGDDDLLYSSRIAPGRGIGECEQVAPGQYTCTTIVPIQGEVTFADAADIDADGDLDLVGGNKATLTLYTNNGGQYAASANLKPAGTGEVHGVLFCDVGAGLQIVTTYALTQIGDSWVGIVDPSTGAYEDVSGPADAVRKPDQAACRDGAIYVAEGGYKTGDPATLAAGLGLVRFSRN